MIELERTKEKKWIFQKNISSGKLIQAYVETINDLKNISAKESIQSNLRQMNAYRGRSEAGSFSTLGVRFSQMCFYMFGYKTPRKMFMPTKMTENILKDKDVGKNMLVNLFSIQFPHPYSKTDKEFEIYAGRLIVKLLTDERLLRRLYIDEFIWFLPFLKNINENSYEELVKSIIEYRFLSYEDKKKMFESVYNYVDIFANCLHECKYYFMKIFKEFSVFELVEDPEHNDGKLFRFKHGNTNTYRDDAINKVPGYVELNNEIIDAAEILVQEFSPFEKPTLPSDEDIYSMEEWKTNLYDVEPLKYLATITPEYSKQSEISIIMDNMEKSAILGSVDGKDFENSLKPVFELFDKIINVEIISGFGDTDLLCLADDEVKPFNLNVDGKCRSSSSHVNVIRLNKHLKKHGSRYCIVVAPKFPRGTIEDMEGQRIVALRSEALAKYCSKECLENKSGQADFDSLNEIIVNNLGTDITDKLNRLTEQRYGILLS